jgi:translation initiation factor IF-3
MGYGRVLPGIRSRVRVNIGRMLAKTIMKIMDYGRRAFEVVRDEKAMNGCKKKMVSRKLRITCKSVRFTCQTRSVKW